MIFNKQLDDKRAKFIANLVIFLSVIVLGANAVSASEIIPCASVRAPLVMEKNGKYFVRIKNPVTCPSGVGESLRESRISIYEISSDEKSYTMISQYPNNRTVRRAKINDEGTLVIFGYEDIVAIDITGSKIFERNVFDIYPEYIDRAHLENKKRVECAYWYCNGWEPLLESDGIILTEFSGCSFWLDLQKGEFKNFIEECDSFIKSNTSIHSHSLR